MNGRRYPVLPKRIVETYIVDCFDIRLPLVHAQFIHDDLRLRLGEFVEVSLPGGMAPLAHPDGALYHGYQQIKHKLEIATTHFGITRIIVIAHEDCAVYNKVLKLPGQEKEDLQAIAAKIRELSPMVDVELYYITFVNAQEAEIERIEEFALVT